MFPESDMDLVFGGLAAVFWLAVWVPPVFYADYSRWSTKATSP